MEWVAIIGLAVVLLFMFPRQFMLTLGALVALAAVGIYYMLDANHRQNERRLAELRSVEAVASIDQRKCSDPAYPVAINFINKSSRTLTKIWFSLHGYRPRHSEPVINEFSFSSDRIIEPGENYGECRSLTNPPPPSISLDELEWRVKVSTLTFQN